MAHPANPAIAVFTANSRDEILEVGGSAAWVVAKSRPAAGNFWSVSVTPGMSISTTMSRMARHFWSAASADLSPMDIDKKGMQRWIIEISEYAVVDYPEAWGEWRNPVKYTTLEELGIDPKKLKFKPMPPPTKDPAAACPARPTKTGALTIAEAKAGLALQFGVPPEAIEIFIKG